MPDLDFTASSSGRQVIEFEDDGVGGPLALGVPQRHAARPPAAPPSQPRAAPHGSGMSSMGRGAVFEEDEESAAGGQGLSLELDVKGGPPIRGGGGLSSGRPASHVSQTGMNASFRPIPAAVHERTPSVAPVETFEAKVLGNFGEAPKHFWQAPFYAWRVRRRLAELRQDLIERRKLAERGAQALEQALVALGQRARSTAERNTQYGRTLDTLRIHEQRLRERDTALMTEMDGHSRKLAVIDQKISELQAVVVQAQGEERRIVDELAMAQAQVQRAEAKLKRLDIDLRSAFGPNDPRRGGS